MTKHREPTFFVRYRFNPNYRAADGTFPYRGGVMLTAYFTRKERAKAMEAMRADPGMQWVEAVDNMGSSAASGSYA